jgi:hypothetical protein
MVKTRIGQQRVFERKPLYHRQFLQSGASYQRAAEIEFSYPAEPFEVRQSERDDSMKESGPPGIMAVYGVSLVGIAKL